MTDPAIFGIPESCWLTVIGWLLCIAFVLLILDGISQALFDTREPKDPE
jgi:hypothetical protein